MIDIRVAWKFVRERGLTISLEVLVNVVLPFAIYEFASPHFGDARALLGSMLPPLGWSLIEFLRSRRVDALSLLVLGGIALSLLAFVGTGSVRMLQLRENLVTGLIGLIFLASVLVRRPLIYVLAQAIMKRRADDAEETDETLEDDETLRRSMMVMTSVWGVGLIAQAGISCVLVFKMSIAEYLIVSPFVGYGGLGVLALWTLWFSRELG